MARKQLELSDKADHGIELTLTLQKCAEEKRARVRQMWPRTGVGWREFSGFGRQQVCNVRVKVH
jgi:hypothetical protein